MEVNTRPGCSDIIQMSRNDREYRVYINLLSNTAVTAITDIWSADYSFYVFSVKVRRLLNQYDMSL